MNEQIKKRCDELFALNMKFNGGSYIGAEDYNKDFNVDYTEITCDSEEEWNEKIRRLKKELTNRLVDNLSQIKDKIFKNKK